MKDRPNTPRHDGLRSRRAEAISTGLAASLDLSRGVYASGSDALKIGLIGCGGRGTGAAAQALTAHGTDERLHRPNVL